MKYLMLLILSFAIQLHAGQVPSDLPSAAEAKRLVKQHEASMKVWAEQHLNQEADKAIKENAEAGWSSANVEVDPDERPYVPALVVRLTDAGYEVHTIKLKDKAVRLEVYWR